MMIFNIWAGYLNLRYNISNTIKCIFKNRHKTTLPDPKKELCIVHFIYNTKGIINAGKNKTESVFAYITEGSTTHDCVPLFNPVGISKGNCIITDIVITPVRVVKPGDGANVLSKKQAA